MDDKVFDQSTVLHIFVIGFHHQKGTQVRSPIKI